MNINRITITAPAAHLESFEQCLRSINVPGITIDNVRGFGEHKNFFRDDLLQSNVRIEMYVGENRVDDVCESIKSFIASSHFTGGILVIETIDRIIDLNTCQDLATENL